MSRILVTDGEQRSSLAATRSLGRAGHDVHVLAYRRNSLAGASRWAAQEHVVPEALHYPADFVESTQAIVRQQEIDLIFPMTDEASVSLLPLRDELGDPVLVGPSLDSYSELSDKGEVVEMAARHGFKIPEGEAVRSWAEASHWSRHRSWPLVLKPTRSVLTNPTKGPVQSPPVKIVQNLDELERAWSDMDGSEALIQDYVDGWGEGIFVLRVKGTTRASFAHRRLREKPPEGGVSVLRESIPVDREVLADLESILDKSDFEGVAMAEFRTNGENRWLMEFNVRFWGSLQLAIDAGVDFPVLAAQAFRKPSAGAEPIPAYRVGVRSRWLIGDLDHAILLARGRSDTHGRRGIGAALRVVFSPAGPGCRWEVLRLSDPRPFWVEFKQWLGAALNQRADPD